MKKILLYAGASLSLALACLKAIGLAVLYAEDPGDVETGFAIKQIVYALVFAAIAAWFWSKRNTGDDQPPSTD